VENLGPVDRKFTYWLKLNTMPFLYCSGSQPVVRVPLVELESNIGNGGKHQKKGVKIKTQKQSYEVSVYKERLM
jgi:hypothetical protein